MLTSTTATKGVGGALVLGGGGTGIYFAVRPRGEFEELDETIVSEEKSKRLSDNSDWEKRESIYFEHYMRVHPYGDKRILWLPTSKSKDSTEKLIEKWCNKRWDTEKIISLTVYWCYSGKTTWLDQTKSEDSKLELKNSAYTFISGTRGDIEEYKKIKEALELGSDDRKFLESIDKPQLTATDEWCQVESKLFYEKKTAAYKAFKENCLRKTS